MSNQLPKGSTYEWNPYRNDAPYDVTNPIQLREFLLELIQTLREQHNLLQAGDSTWPWELSTEISDIAQYSLGSIGRFRHPDYGIITCRYVQFDHLGVTWSGAPYGYEFNNKRFNWKVTNQLARSNPYLVAGLGAAYVVPKDGQYGWVIIEGVNTQSIKFEGLAAPTSGMNVRWQRDSRVGLAEGGIIATIMEGAGIEQFHPEGWELLAGSLRVQIRGQASTDDADSGLTQEQLDELVSRVLVQSGIQHLENRVNELELDLTQRDSQNIILKNEMSRLVGTVQENLETLAVTVSTQDMTQYVSGILTSLEQLSIRIQGINAVATADYQNLRELVASLNPRVATLETLRVTNEREGVELYAAVEVAAEATGTLEGRFNAKFSIKLDVNGHWIGSEWNNDGTVGGLTQRLDYWKLVDASDPTNPVAPFEYDNTRPIGQRMRIKEALIGNLTIDKLADGNMEAQLTVNGAGKIVFDNGTFMKVTGIGFGTTGQFLEWFGPTMDFNLCNEDNGINWTKTNGDAYWGGNTSSGEITSMKQQIDTSATAILETDAITSNGGNIRVALSYLFQSGNPGQEGGGSYDFMTPPPDGYGPTDTGDTTATINLYRKVGAGAYTHVDTLVVSGDRIAEYTVVVGEYDPFSASGEYYTYYTFIESASGSLVYVDTNNTTDVRQYKAEIVARSTQYPGGAPTYITQNITIRTTE